jgi:hypothetical protein
MEEEIGEACSRSRKNAYRTLIGSLKGRDNLEYIEVDGSTVSY